MRPFKYNRAADARSAAKAVSANPEAMFMNRPGIKIVYPGTAYDAKGLLKAAVRDDDPVFGHERRAPGGVEQRGDRDVTPLCTRGYVALVADVGPAVSKVLIPAGL